MTELPFSPARERQCDAAVSRPASSPLALPDLPVVGPDDMDVQRLAFKEAVASMYRTILTAPLGWALVSWLCWVVDAAYLLPGWLPWVACGWIVCMLLLNSVRRQGPDVTRHGGATAAAAIIDGLCWGSMAPCLMGADPLRNVLIAAVLLGVAAVNAPVYITRFRLFFFQGVTMWLVAAGNALLRDPMPPMAHAAAVGLAGLLGLLAFYLQGISRRMVSGIRLRLANAALAEQLRRALEAMARQAGTDALTGVPNRRSLDAALAEQCAIAERDGRPCAVLMLDLDHFKAINDTHGHAVGDAVLAAFGHRLQSQLRASDLCARYGGEEFVVLVSGATDPLVEDIAERLRASVSASPLVDGVVTTVSIGTASHSAGDDPASLLARADRALYEAKRSGRNRVVAG